MIDSNGQLDNNKLEEKIFDTEINIIGAIQEIIRDSRSLEEADIKIKEFKNMIEMLHFHERIDHRNAQYICDKLTKLSLKNTGL